MDQRKPFNRFKKREPHIPIEKKIESFVLRNSKNGYFTKISTISYKFEISENRMWDVVGELLGDGSFEAMHDDMTGEMKLCEVGKTYHILDLERKRKHEKPRSFTKKKK